jgi:penicillin amidase
MRTALRYLRRLLLVILALASVGLAGVAGLVWLTIPSGDLTAGIPGLSADSSITIDQDGIPRITAQNERDAGAALGFLHARERLFQMDLMRRAARGELSEIAGAATLPLDRLARTLGIARAAETDLAGLSAETRAMLDAYASGVNAWISAHGRLSALEFTLIGTPRPWTALDSLLWGKTMGLYLSANWRTELARLALGGRLTRAEIEALWPTQTAAPTQAGITPQPDPNAFAAASRLAMMLPHFPAPFTLPPSASNAWVVDATQTATGAPILAGDPHLSFGLPGIWYLARIQTPQSLLVGATAPGVPFLVIGHNGHIAWSFTTTGADVQDLFVETPDGAGYATETGPRPFETASETLHIRGQPDEILTIRRTRHGPVISDLTDPKGPIIAVAMANLAPGDTAPEGLLALNHARSVAEAGAAAPRITSPVQNMMVADRTTIGFFVTGRVPLRASGDGAFASNGADGSGEWVGWASGTKLPHHVAPPSGRLVNANERVALKDFPIPLGRDWFGDARARRIRAMLTATPKANLSDMARMQSDCIDIIAQEILPRLIPLAPELAGWDGCMDRNRAEPLLFQSWMSGFYHALLVQAGTQDGAAAAPWPDLVRHALSPAGAGFCGECDGLLRQTLTQARSRLSTRFGSDAAKWRWGDAHQAVFAHPILRFIPLLGRLTEARIEQDGGDSTVGRGGVRQDSLESVHGASFRGVFDLADLDRSLVMIAPGQSGHPASPLARNFVRNWRDGDTITLGPNPATVSARIRPTP